MQDVRINWGSRKAAWCAVDVRGELVEGTIPADEGGLARLVDNDGPDARRYVETTSGAVWVRERLRSCGWQFQIPDARKVKAIAPVACKTDRVDVEVQTRRTGPRVSASGLGRATASRIYGRPQMPLREPS